jgi:hypothetical protein
VRNHWQQGSACALSTITLIMLRLYDTRHWVPTSCTMLTAARPGLYSWRSLNTGGHQHLPQGLTNP